MPEMRLVVRWPDGRRESCYSQSRVVKDFFREGESYSLEDFLRAQPSGARDRLGAG